MRILNKMMKGIDWVDGKKLSPTSVVQSTHRLKLKDRIQRGSEGELFTQWMAGFWTALSERQILNKIFKISR